jgi:mono/diheme cytochrome c family protein
MRPKLNLFVFGVAVAMATVQLIDSRRPVFAASEPSRLPSSSESARFRYDNLVELIKSKKLNSVDQVVPHLPGALLRNFTLMKESESLQKSTPDNPRAILFGDDAKMIITFGGDPNNAASKNLEIMQFNDGTKKFELHEISFENSLPKYSSAQEIKNRCTACHGQDVRPIWTTYPKWLGAYGSVDDIVGSEELKEERAKWNHFRANLAQQSPAYRALFSGHEHQPYWPYSETYDSRTMATMPNFRLNLLLIINSAQKNARLIESSPLFEKLKYSVLHGGYCFQQDDRSAELRVFELLRKYASMPLDENQSRQKWQISASRQMGFLNFFNIAKGDTSLLFDRYAGRDSNGGVSLTGPHYMEGDETSLTSNYVYSYLIKHAAQKDSVLAEMIGQTSAEIPESSGVVYTGGSSGFLAAVKNSGLPGFFKIKCDILGQKMHNEVDHLEKNPAALKAALINTPVVVAANTQLATVAESNIDIGKNLLQSVGCVACHSSGYAPDIKFADPEVFAQQNYQAYLKGESLLAKAKKRMSSNDIQVQMPSGGRHLSNEEQAAILAYLQKVVSGK